MGIYLEMILSNKSLEIASKFAWDNKLNITIIYNSENGVPDYVCVDETKEPDGDYTYIKIDDFKTIDELDEYIATSIIGG